MISSLLISLFLAVFAPFASGANYYVGTDPILLSNYDCTAVAPCYLQFVLDHNATDSDTITFDIAVLTHNFDHEFIIRNQILTFAGNVELAVSAFPGSMFKCENGGGATDFTFQDIGYSYALETPFFTNCEDLTLRYEDCSFDFTSTDLHPETFFSANHSVVDLRFIRTNFSVSHPSGAAVYTHSKAESTVLFDESIITDAQFHYNPEAKFTYTLQKSEVTGTALINVATQDSPDVVVNFIESEIHHVSNGNYYVVQVACCYRCNSKLGTFCATIPKTNIYKMDVHDNFMERGVFHFISNNVTARDSIFYRNHAENDGACFYVEATSMLVENVKFYNNFAGFWTPPFNGLLKPYGGGAIFSFSTIYTLINIRDCVFINNTASGGGGDLFFMNEEKSDVIIENSIHLYSSGHDGGAFYFPAVEMKANIRNSTFTGCNAIQKGGTFYLRSGDYFKTCTYHNFVMHGVRITQSRAEKGGAMFVESSCIIADDLGIENCVAKFGAGMYLDTCHVRIDESLPSRNETGVTSYIKHCGETGYTQKGGAVYAYDAYFDTFNDFNMTYNKAYYGAGLYCWDLSLWSDVNYAKHGSYGLETGIIYIMYNEGVVGAAMATNSRHFGNFDGKIIVRDNVATEVKARDVFIIEKLDTDWATFAGHVRIEDHDEGVDCRDHDWSNVDCRTMTYPSGFEAVNGTISEIFPNEEFEFNLKAYDSFGTAFEVYDDYTVEFLIDDEFTAKTILVDTTLSFKNIQVEKEQNTTVKLSFVSESLDFTAVKVDYMYTLGSCGVGYGYSNVKFCEECHKFEYKVIVGDVPCSYCPPREMVAECEASQISMVGGYYGVYSPVSYGNYTTRELLPYKCLDEKVCGEGTTYFVSNMGEVESEYDNVCSNDTHFDPSSPLCSACLPGYSNWGGECKTCGTSFFTSFNMIPFLYYVGIILLLLLFQHLTSQSIVVKRYQGSTVDDEQKEATGFPLILSDFIQTSGLLIVRYNLYADLTIFLGQSDSLTYLVSVIVSFYILCEDFLRRFLASAFNLENFGSGGGCPFYIGGTGIILVTVLEKFFSILIIIGLGFVMYLIKIMIIKPIEKASKKAKEAISQVSSADKSQDHEDVGDEKLTKEEIKLRAIKKEKERIKREKIEYEKKNFCGKLGSKIVGWLKVLGITLGKSLTFSGFLRTLSRLLIISHLPLTTAFFDIFTCSSIGDSYYLLADTRVKCFEGWEYYLFMVIVGIPLGLYVFFIPFIMLYLLFKYKDKVRIEGHQSQDYLREYYANYKLEYFWYEIVHTFRRMSLAAIVSLGKVVSVSFPTFAGSEIMICGIIMSFSLVLHILIRPYKTNVENIFEMISLTVVLLMIGMQEQGITMAAIIGRFLTSFVAFAFSAVLLLSVIYHTESIRRVLDYIRVKFCKIFCRRDVKTSDPEEDIEVELKAFKNWKDLKKSVIGDKKTDPEKSVKLLGEDGAGDDIELEPIEIEHSTIDVEE